MKTHFNFYYIIFILLFATLFSCKKVETPVGRDDNNSNLNIGGGNISFIINGELVSIDILREKIFFPTDSLCNANPNRCFTSFMCANAKYSINFELHVKETGFYTCNDPISFRLVIMEVVNGQLTGKFITTGTAKESCELNVTALDRYRFVLNEAQNIFPNIDKLNATFEVFEPKFDGSDDIVISDGKIEASYKK